ncbi:MAG: flagellar hook-associated protein FlgL [Desulfatiglans sp.]|jgi:flagellar hook-associated protein 3 FlgL|nr:flagellar hook-associated protein FlgL [Desulfatiglans sp.]
MRVANKTLYDGTIRNLNRTSSGMVEANETVSTNKRINNLSDDPVGLVAVLGLRSSLSNLNQMERNISMGNSWLKASESALTQVNNILTSTKELTVAMSSANTNASQREGNVDLVDGYLKEIISLANSSTGGRYIFGGTNTDTIPFELDASATQVAYSGNDTAFSINIGKDSVVPVGRDGKDVFGANWDDSNIFKTLVDLKTSLETNDISGIQGAMTKLDEHMKNINANISDIGGKTIRLDVKKEVVTDLKLTDTERMSELEDADLAAAVINLKSKELAYNAALSSSSKMMQLSLVNFI